MNKPNQIKYRQLSPPMEHHTPLRMTRDDRTTLRHTDHFPFYSQAEAGKNGRWHSIQGTDLACTIFHSPLKDWRLKKILFCILDEHTSDLFCMLDEHTYDLMREYESTLSAHVAYTRLLSGHPYIWFFYLSWLSWFRWRKELWVMWQEWKKFKEWRKITILRVKNHIKYNEVHGIKYNQVNPSLSINTNN